MSFLLCISFINCVFLHTVVGKSFTMLAGKEKCHKLSVFALFYSEPTGMSDFTHQLVLIEIPFPFLRKGRGGGGVGSEG